METSREDVGIVLRSALLGRGAQQRFSLFILVIVCFLLLFTETIETKPLNYLRSFVRDTIYRGSLIVSSPIKGLKFTLGSIGKHINIYNDYDKLKNELSPIIMSSSDEKSETTQPEDTPTNQKTIQQSQQKPSETKKRSKWVYIGIVVFILWVIGVMMPPTNSSSGSSSSYSSSSYKYYCDECGDGISGQPYQCILYKCTKARTVSSSLDTFCSCSCGVEHRRREGFQYTCN